MAEWIGLTDEEGHRIINGCHTGTTRETYKAIEAALRDRNVSYDGTSEVVAALRECLEELKGHNESAYCELRGDFDDVIERAENAIAKNSGEQA